MIPHALTVFSVIAACFYWAVASACLLAVVPALSHRQVRWHKLVWVGLAAFFVLLAISRALAFEDILRENLRFLLRAEGAYDQRRALQGPIFAAIFVGAAAIAGFWFYRVMHNISGRRNIATVLALASGGIMTFLVLLRIVSLHSVDELLYGPLKLNWLTDIGSSVLVLACAVYYWAVVTGRAR